MLASVTLWAAISAVTALLIGVGIGTVIGCFISSPLIPDDRGDI